jgi:hypothetical protein
MPDKETRIKHGQCWNASLPCTPYPNRKLELRGQNLENGFKISEDAIRFK